MSDEVIIRRVHWNEVWRKREDGRYDYTVESREGEIIYGPTLYEKLPSLAGVPRFEV